jgi:hypothetical protein
MGITDIRLDWYILPLLCMDSKSIFISFLVLFGKKSTENITVPIYLLSLIHVKLFII